MSAEQIQRYMSIDRLDRIEEKLDRLSDAIVALARVEEKIISIESNNAALITQMSGLQEKIDRTETRMTAVETKQILDGQIVAGLRKFFWMTISAILGGAFLTWFTYSMAAVAAHRIAGN